MKGRRGEIYGGLEELEVEGLVHKGAGQTPRGQESRTGAPREPSAGPCKDRSITNGNLNQQTQTGRRA